MEYAEIIIKRKWTVIIITAFCIVISSFLNYFILDREYQVNSVVNIQPLQFKSHVTSKDIKQIVDNGSLNSSSSLSIVDNKMLETILDKIKYPSVTIDYIVDNINTGQYKKNALKNTELLKLDYNIDVVANIPDNVLNITITGKNPQNIIAVNKNIINYIPIFIENSVNKQLKKASNNVNSEIKREKNNIDLYQKQIMEFNETNNNYNIKNNEKEFKYKNMSEYKEIYNNYVLANNFFDTYMIANRELQHLTKIDIKDLLHFKIVSSDKKPKLIYPQIQKNIALATILGFITSVILVLILEWKIKFIP